MRTPNSEQKRAIECSGDVLLSAGAGSGKTYVLVEHVMFLAGRLIEQKNYSDTEDFFRKIKKYFSGIVLITFTRKSTSEIRLRMKKRLEAKVLEEETGEIWGRVSAALPLLNISTIHGFCSLLLRQGFFPGFGRNFEIMSDIEGRRRIEKLFVEWFEIEREKDSFKRDEKNYETIIANRNSIIGGLVKIFNDSTLRNGWKEFCPDNIKIQELGGFMEEYLYCTGLDKIFSEKIAVNKDGQLKKWQLLLENFYKLADQFQIGTVEGIEAFHDLLQSFKRIIPPQVKGDNKKIRDRIEGIKDLKNFLKEHKDDLVAFEKYRDNMKQWERLFRSAFNYIENQYRRNPKMSYSDLEYYVFEGLKDRDIAEKISNIYQYVVVDEFQDTSHIQFEIIKKIVKEDYKKLFCVGDYKQAIYGFRGGEIGVFEKCRENVENNLELACNFRSEKTVVDFNNRFFSALLDCGENFKNICEKNHITISQQAMKNGDEGIVLRHKIVGSDKESNIEKIEARKIFDLINRMKKTGDISEVAILYKKLMPSKFLMEHLLLNKIPFVAQVKIPYGEDFVVGLCTILLEFCLLYREQTHSLEKLIDYPRFMILAYFNLTGLSEPENLISRLKKFLVDVRLYGFESAFCGFYYDLGISNSNYGQSIRIIKDLYDMFGEDMESIYNSLRRNIDQKYSLDVHFGEKKDNELKVIIMTVHSSKGLEFEHVILGGINGVGRSRVVDNYIGKHPTAIKWKVSSDQKKPFQSPRLILEKYISSQKEFAETKRLFYVACTRAVKGLHWMDISVDKNINDKSWAVALRKWCDLTSNQGVDVREDFWDGEEGESLLACKSNVWRMVERDEKKASIILPEISVSGFVSITQCPRKFYLQNICRFEKDSEHFSLRKKSFDAGESAVSSTSRGTAWHKKISDMIGNGWEGLSRIENKKEQEIFYWIKKLLSTFYATGGEIFSEIPVKFSFFGQVISGTADLVVSGGERKLLEVWDFKTGRRDESYWFQLFCYAYGFALKYDRKAEENVNMAIVYLDKKEIVRKSVSLNRIKGKISKEWIKTDDLNQVNREHCPICCYRDLCRPDNLSPESEKY